MVLWLVTRSQSELKGPKPRIYKGFEAPEPWFLMLGRHETSYFTWFGSILGSKIAPQGPPAGGPQEAENSAIVAFLHLFYVSAYVQILGAIFSAKL